MMAGLPWRLALAACFLSAVVTPGLSRSVPQDGICNRVKQYMPGEGRRAVDGMTLIYCATETDLLCSVRPDDQVCCRGWKKDPDSKELRCIKIDPSDAASIGTDLDYEEDFARVPKVWNDLKREAGVVDSVIRPRGSRAAPASKTDQGGVNATDGQSVQNPKQVAQSGMTDPVANGTGTEQGNQTNPPVVAGPAGIDANHSLTDGNQPAKPQSSGTGETRSGPDAASRAGLPPANNGDAEKLPTISSTTTGQEPSKDGSVPANGTASQLEGPPHVETHPESANNATSHSAVNQSEAESQTPAKNEHNAEHEGSILTGAVVIVDSSVTHASDSEAPTSPSEQSGGNRASAESRAPATPPEQRSDNRASVNNSEAPAIPLGQSSDNHAGVNNSQPPTSTPAQSSGNHAGVNNSQPPTNTPAQSSDNHAGINNSQPPTSTPAQSRDNHAGVNNSQPPTSTPAQSSGNHAGVNNHQPPTSTPAQSSDNHAGINNSQPPTSTPAQSSNNNASVNKSDAPVISPGQSIDIPASVNPSQAPVTPMGQSGNNRANANKSEAPTSPLVQSSDNHASVSNNQPPVSTPAQSSDNRAGVNKNEPPTSPPGQSGDSHASVNKSQTPATPPEQSGDNHASVNKSEAPVSPEVQSGGNLTSVNNTGASAHVQPDQKTQDTTPLTLSSKDLAHGRHVEIVPSTDSTPVAAKPATSANVPLPEATTTKATGTAATHPAQNGTSHSSVPSVTAATPVIDRSGTTAGKPTVVPAPRHPNALAGNDTIEYSVMAGTNRSSGNRTLGTSARNNSSVPTGQQGAANTTEKNGNATSAANCTAAGHERNCTGANCSFPENQTVCNVTSQTVGLQMPAAAKPQPHGASPLPPSGSAAKTASEVTISLLLVTAVIFVAVLLYWRNRRRRRQYINCGTREPNLHFSNPVYDLEAMMEQTSLVKLQNAADIEDGDGDDSEHEAASQRK